MQAIGVDWIFGDSALLAWVGEQVPAKRNRGDLRAMDGLAGLRQARLCSAEKFLLEHLPDARAVDIKGSPKHGFLAARCIKSAVENDNPRGLKSRFTALAGIGCERINQSHEIKWIGECILSLGAGFVGARYS